MMRDLRRMLRSPFVVGALLVLIYVCVTFMIHPVLTILQTTFFPDGAFSTRALGRLVASEKAMTSLRNSFILAFALSVTVNLVGIFIVLATRYFHLRGSRILFLGYATSLIYGGVALVSGYKFLYGSTGLLTKAMTTLIPAIPANWFHGFPAVLFIMTFACTGNHLLFLSSALAKVDHQTIEAAAMMGAGPWQVLRSVVLPMLKPMVFAVTILTFLTGLGAMAAPLIVGGTDFQTIAPMVLTFAQIPTSRDLAATLALLLGLATIVLILVMNLLERGGQYFSVSKVPATMRKQKIANPVANAVVHVAGWGLWIVYILPPVFVILFSFTDAATIQSGEFTAQSFTLANYQAVLGSPSGFQPFLVSLCYAGAASIATVGLMLLAARIINKYKSWLTTTLEYVLHLPWILHSTLISLALLITFSNRDALIGGQALSGTVFLLFVAYVVVKIPFTFRLLKAAFVGIQGSLEEAAALLGARQGYILRTVLLPLVLPATAAVFALNFNSLMDDYDIAAFLAHPLYQPLGLFIRSATSGETLGDSIALVFVYTVLLMLIASIVMWAVYGRHGRSDRQRSRKTARLTAMEATQ